MGGVTFAGYAVESVQTRGAEIASCSVRSADFVSKLDTCAAVGEGVACERFNNEGRPYQGYGPAGIAFDGADIWTANIYGNVASKL